MGVGRGYVEKASVAPEEFRNSVAASAPLEVSIFNTGKETLVAVKIGGQETPPIVLRCNASAVIRGTVSEDTKSITIGQDGCSAGMECWTKFLVKARLV